MISRVSSDLLLCIQLFINFAGLFYYVFVYVLKDAAKYDLRYACSRCSCGLDICCIAIEGGFDNANGSSSLESLNPRIVWSRAGPQTPILTYFSCRLAIGHMHMRMTGTVTFIVSVITASFLFFGDGVREQFEKALWKKYVWNKIILGKKRLERTIWMIFRLMITWNYPALSQPSRFNFMGIEVTIKSVQIARTNFSEYEQKNTKSKQKCPQ